MRIDESLTNKFGQQIEVQGKSKRRLFLTVPKAIALEVCRFLKEELGARFSTISGVDTRSAVELLFHLPIDREHLVVTLRVPVAKPDLEMPTAYHECFPTLAKAGLIDKKLALNMESLIKKRGLFSQIYKIQQHQKKGYL